ncbi:MAG TPA: squalene/phytoene synthase family protein [Solirubrobacteraceae bacterium]|jgi:phytoene synthase
MTPTGELAEDYRRCEEITRREAANFYWGIRLLPADRRHAMSAVYAFARRVDDIGDGSLAGEEKLRLLDAAAAELRAAEAGAPGPGAAGGDPVMRALADAHVRFALPAGALGELIEGVRMDVAGVRYETFEEMVLYCRRVAGAIGRVCLAIFGLREGVGGPAAGGAEALADDLGVALQLTNILRDVREDAENGRAYLPAEDLRRFGLIAAGQEAEAPALLGAMAVSADGRAAAGEGQLDRFTALVHFEAERVREWFERGMALAPLLDRRSAACVLAMAGIYRRVLERIDADPAASARGRTSLAAHEKAWVAARGMLGAGATG